MSKPSAATKTIYAWILCYLQSLPLRQVASSAEADPFPYLAMHGTYQRVDSVRAFEVNFPAQASEQRAPNRNLTQRLQKNASKPTFHDRGIK